MIQSPEAKAKPTDPKSGPVYSDDQGRHARMAAFWSATLLSLFGCTFLHTLLVGVDSLSEPLGGLRIPVVSIDVTGAFLISTGVFAGLLLAIRRWQERPKTIQLLVGTESELRKVTWPGLDEVMNSSLVVVICVVFIGAFLAGVDYVLARVMSYLLLGEV